MYSQNQEEKHITDYFQNKIGKLIDIGAFHVSQLSNTRRLVELGWSGVLVEADPKNYEPIAEFYKDETQIDVLNVAIGTSNEPLTFYSSNGDAVSTSDIEHKEKWQKGGINYTEITVPQKHIVQFLEYFGHDVDFISIDTEATNMDIFRAIPDWFWSQISMLCIEHDNCVVEIVGKLESFGFQTKYLNAENIILAK
jgi:FkbM family methyltransferase